MPVPLHFFSLLLAGKAAHAMRWARRLGLLLALSCGAASAQAQRIGPAERDDILRAIDADVQIIREAGEKLPSVKSVPQWVAVVDQSLFSVLRDLQPLRTMLGNTPDYTSLRTLVAEHRQRAIAIQMQRHALEAMVAAADFKRFDALPSEAVRLKLQANRALVAAMPDCASASALVQRLLSATQSSVDLGTGQALQTHWRNCAALADGMNSVAQSIAAHGRAMQQITDLSNRTPRFKRMPQYLDLALRQQASLRQMGDLAASSLQLAAYADAGRNTERLLADFLAVAHIAVTADAAARAGDSHSVTVFNLSKTTRTVYWIGMGCSQIEPDFIPVDSAFCSRQRIEPGQFASASYKPGATSLRLMVQTAGCGQRMIPVAQAASGADMHVIEEGCEIKPDSVAFTEQQLQSIKFLINLHPVPVDAVFTSVGCAAPLNGYVFACQRTIIPANERASYVFHDLTITRNVAWKFLGGPFVGNAIFAGSKYPDSGHTQFKTANAEGALKH